MCPARISATFRICGGEAKAIKGKTKMLNQGWESRELALAGEEQLADDDDNGGGVDPGAASQPSRRKRSFVKIGASHFIDRSNAIPDSVEYYVLYIFCTCRYSILQHTGKKTKAKSLQ